MVRISMREATPLSGPRESVAVSPKRSDRRPIRSRNPRCAQAIASYLAALGVSPNQISLASVLALLVGERCLFVSSHRPNTRRFLFIAKYIILCLYLVSRI